MVSSDQYAACSQEELVQKLEKEKASKQKLRQALVSVLQARPTECLQAVSTCTMLLLLPHNL